jgi:hypothetical protein
MLVTVAFYRADGASFLGYFLGIPRMCSSLGEYDLFYYNCEINMKTLGGKMWC